jgi:hypothetical protein
MQVPVEIDPWAMRLDDERIEFSLDSGDSGFVVLTNDQARQLRDALTFVLEAEG